MDLLKHLWGRTMSEWLYYLQHTAQCGAAKMFVESLMVCPKICGAQNGETLTLPGRRRSFHRGGVKFVLGLEGCVGGLYREKEKAF